MLDVAADAQRIANEQLARERAEAAAPVTDREKLAMLIKERDASRLEGQQIRTAAAKTAKALKAARDKEADAQTRVEAGTKRLADRIIAAVREGLAINTEDDPEAIAAQREAVDAQKQVEAAQAEIRKLEAAGGVIGTSISEPERRAAQQNAQIDELATTIMYAEAMEIMRQALVEHQRLWTITDLIAGWEFTPFKDRATPEFTKMQQLFGRRATVLETDGRMQNDWEWNRYVTAKAHDGATRWKAYHERLCRDASATLDPA